MAKIDTSLGLKRLLVLIHFVIDDIPTLLPKMRRHNYIVD